MTSKRRDGVSRNDRTIEDALHEFGLPSDEDSVNMLIMALAHNPKALTKLNNAVRSARTEMKRDGMLP